jgi:regulator of protease activity HflC (stomatin/prohibitin superfamily)
MAAYGIQVAKCLVVDMQPDASVMASMNQINAARRQREAAIERAEAEKIMAVRCLDPQNLDPQTLITSSRCGASTPKT